MPAKRAHLSDDPSTPGGSAPERESGEIAERQPLTSAPEVVVRYAVAGQETLSAIAEDLQSRNRECSAPELELSEAPAGRETLGAIAEELTPGGRPPMATLRYGDRVSNAPGAVTPRTRTLLRSAPEITVAEAAVGRETLAAIEQELGSRHAVREAVASAPLDVYEMITFVMRGPQVVELASERGRRAFVEHKLLSRLPVESMAEVERIDVAPWTVRDAVIVRIWCRVALPE